MRQAFAIVAIAAFGLVWEVDEAQARLLDSPTR